MTSYPSRIDVQVSLKSHSIKNFRELEKFLFNLMCRDPEKLSLFIQSAHENNNHLCITHSVCGSELENKIERIEIFTDESFNNNDNFSQSKSSIDEAKFTWKNFFFVFYFYHLYEEELHNNIEESSPSSFHTLLPSKRFKGLWESLVFDSSIKSDLLNYVQTSILFSKYKVDPATINWNKLLLLHGPPGTGKTSLCKALCQKLSIILNDQYEQFQLIEINSHSLFSKWFSESGKLVLQLFENIKEFAQMQSHMIFVLIDEVESLAYNRQRTNGSDPSDAIRVVNALLTQIDAIKSYSNVIILANSNITQVMDEAFVDRVDMKVYIGHPLQKTIYQIYFSCINELVRSKLIICWEKSDSFYLYSYQKLINSNDLIETENLKCSRKLLEIARLSENHITGRTLRKLPFLAYALHKGTKNTMMLDEFLSALEIMVQKQLSQNNCLLN